MGTTEMGIEAWRDRGLDMETLDPMLLGQNKALLSAGCTHSTGAMCVLLPPSATHSPYTHMYARLYIHTHTCP